MRYLWDTDICVHFLNGDKKILQKTKKVGAENICTTVINIYELMFGAYNSTRVKSNLERVKKLQARLTILDSFDDSVGNFFAKTKAQLRKKGITISDFDLLIASFASVNDFRIVTNNTKHFNHISGLKVENWLAK
ncbi:MAG: PIN domain-containing protein [Candidatus Aminicenantes bacterium]|nr:PIN domain-containing protein [Candidatus Aminicenantes bacterium]NIM77844.1 PIN domain-containing protein [Candidatus Aminicenantes bacterium]NIN17156.1 PIN domain-containing protein [Candidatus Aminicenantes bacterium]NIN41049.1 PIN domain-containing protein [Candidatus Aminicenantes bacterium]NIN83854.1 PIN domain-containing protein [Candidatus Aminicenantes bacterium]